MVLLLLETTLDGKLFVVIGAGGAGKALAYGGRAKGARVVVANRTYEKAKELASKVDGKAITLSELNDFHPEEGMVLANTTSVGMKPRVDDTPISKELIDSMGIEDQAMLGEVQIGIQRRSSEEGRELKKRATLKLFRDWGGEKADWPKCREFRDRGKCSAVADSVAAETLRFV